MKATRTSAAEVLPSNNYTNVPNFDFDASELLQVLGDNNGEKKGRPKRRAVQAPPLAKSAKRPSTASEEKRQDDEDSDLPPARPPRPLSAYNLFFKFERARLLSLIERGESVADHPPCVVKVSDIRKLLRDNPYHVDHRTRLHRKSHGKVSFSDLFKFVLSNWKGLTSEMRAPFEEIAAENKAVYETEAEAYKLWKRREQWRKNKARSRKRKKKESSSPSSRANVKAESKESAQTWKTDNHARARENFSEPVSTPSVREPYVMYSTRSINNGNTGPDCQYSAFEPPLPGLPFNSSLFEEHPLVSSPYTDSTYQPRRAVYRVIEVSKRTSISSDYSINDI